MNGFVVHRLYAKPLDEFVCASLQGNVSDKVFDEDRVVVGALSHCFLIWTLQHAVQLAAGTGFDEFDQVLDPDRLMKAHGESDQSSLVVGSPFADSLGARAESGHGNFYSDDIVNLISFCVDLKDDAIVQQALCFCDGRPLGAKIRKAHFHMRFLGVQPDEEFLRHRRNAGHGQFPAMRVEDLQEAAHVRSLEVMGEIHRHVDRCDRVLGSLVAVANAQGKTDILDADSINGQSSVITLVLGVFESGHGGL